MRLEGLNENHERGLLARAQYASTLIRDCEQILTATEHPRPFSRYAGTVTPPQRKILRDYLRRLDIQLARVLEGLGLKPPDPSVDALWAINTALSFLDTTGEEMRLDSSLR